MERLTRWLWALAIAMLSALLVVYAYDIKQGTSGSGGDYINVTEGEFNVSLE